jgi:2'-5' RNA ligase
LTTLIENAAAADVPRAFLACRLPHAAEDDLARRLADAKRSASARVYRWIRREHWHLTLRFFGALPAARFEAADAAVASAAADSTPFLARLVAVRALPSWRQPHVVAFVLASDGALEALATRLDAGLVDVVGAPDKPFLPHLSVLRVRHPRPSDVGRVRAAFEAIDVSDAPQFEVASMTLYRSDLERDGPHYTALRVYPFASAAQASPS